MNNKNLKENKLFLTKENVKELKDELKDLKEVKRPNIIKEVKTAREQGDLSENAEYDAAKEKQAIIEKRIVELNEVLENYRLVKEKNDNLIRIGSIVELKILDTNKIMKVKIGTSFDVDIEKNIISNVSILGSSILNKRKGDTIFIKNPINPYRIEILDIK